MDDKLNMRDIASQARQASVITASLPGELKNLALQSVAEALRLHGDIIISANKADLANAESAGLASALLKRLKFDQEKLNAVISGIESLRKLPDPVGCQLDATRLDNDLILRRVSCPIGVLGIVFESRPDALVQISTLAIKSGNAVLLKGGSEATLTNAALAKVIDYAACQAGFPAGWLALLQSRDDVKAMLAMDEFIDLVIPRGSNDFVRYIMDNTRIPVMGHADGICHVFIDDSADMEMAVKVAFDSKCQYPAVCNAMETLLVSSAVAEKVLPVLAEAYGKAGVELRGDERVCKLIKCNKATEQDWATEYNDLILSIAIVDSLEEAIEHINKYGSGHTDCIVTQDKQRADVFMARVDSASVFCNCSTRFADGFRYGLGAEVGISTGKIHARGPVGLEGLTIYKWLMTGNGHAVADFEPDKKPYLHDKHI
ncbi:MAG: glutamate-5-semialdehyde dehydrogenase [Sedimentisphaerales bacterium]|nr:glutamate-5-semialdehyde dehydrogenase [Sedimentisphaerales bacterium]